MLDKATRMLVGLAIAILIARMLGPDAFGKFSYAIAFVSLLAPLAALGLNSVVVRDLVREPEQRGHTLGSAFALQFLSGLLASLLSAVVLLLLQPQDALTRWLCFVMGLTLPLKAGEVVRSWFESRLESRKLFMIDWTVVVGMGLARALAIFADVPLVVLAATLVLEAGLLLAGYLWVYWRQTQLKVVWSFRLKRSVELLRDGWPLLLSGLTVAIYMRIDQLMIGSLLGPIDLGAYSAAVRISEAWYFVPVAMAASSLPLIAARSERGSLEPSQHGALYVAMIRLSVLFALAVSLAAETLVEMVFGRMYQQAASVVAVHVWTGVFVSLGVISGNWYLSQGMQKKALWRTFWGAVINLAGNALLIPVMGIQGAALSTLIAQFFAAYLFDGLDTRTRPLFALKSRALMESLLPRIPRAGGAKQ